MRRLFLTKTAIIRRPSSAAAWLLAALCAVLLAGCSNMRLAYGNGERLTWWWLDGYVDFSREQAPRAKEAIARWFEWHRSTQLADVAGLLVSAQGQVLVATTPAQVCHVEHQWRAAVEPALDRALQQAAELVPGLGDAQRHSMEKTFAKKLADLRRDFAQPDAEDRSEAAVKRALDRAEMLYGSLEASQRRVIRANVAASPFDPAAMLAERERRYADIQQTLHRLAGERADHARTVAALRGVVDRFETSPDAAYRAYHQRLTDYNCAAAAQLHNATTPAQRRAARDRLKGWEDDVRGFITQASAR